MASCAFLLDTDELREGTGGGGAGGGDAGPGGAGGVAGSAGEAGGGGAAGQAGQAGQAGASGGGAAGTGGGGQSIPIEDAPAAMAQAVCETLRECLGPGIEVVYGDEDCVVTTTRVFEDAIAAPFVSSIGESRAEYHADLMPACVEAYRNASCEETSALPDACVEAMEGLVPIGSPCFNTMECEGQAFCQIQDVCPGTCTERLQQGDTCTETDICEPELSCFENVCQRTPTQGEDCGDAYPACAAGLLCIGEDKIQNEPGTCLALADAYTRGEGFSCDVGELSLCADSLHCAVDSVMAFLAMTGTCVGETGSGEDCQIALPDSCAKGFYCRTPSKLTVDGICAKLPADGEPCGTGLTLKRPCEAYHRCIEVSIIDDICYAMVRIGEECVDDAQCYSGYCAEQDCTESTCPTVCKVPSSCPSPS